MRRFHSGTATLGILAVAVLCTLLACLLPTDPYQRRTQLEGTIYDTPRWIYDRTHFDATPIDIVFLGASRTMLAISAPRLEADLAARGLNVKAVNFGVVGSGRNIQWLFVEDLLRTKRPRLLVLEINEKIYPYGHQAFGFVAPNAAILAPPLLGMHDWPYHLAELPYRNLRLFAASLFPAALGIADRFDPAGYRGTSRETTTSFLMPDGKYIDMDAIVPRETLDAGARAFEQRPPPHRYPRRSPRGSMATTGSTRKRSSRWRGRRGSPSHSCSFPIFRGRRRSRRMIFMRVRGPCSMAASSPMTRVCSKAGRTSTTAARSS